MSCNYQNIYDLCANKYTYEYSKVKFISAVASSGFNEYAGSFTDVDPYSEVIRTDKDTGFKEVITQYSTNNIEHCDFSTESQSITAWDCYQVYKQQGGIVNEPSLEVFRDAKYKQITDEYNNSLINGVSVTIDDKTITLDASLDSQIYYRNIANTAQALYNADVDSTMPKFVDKNNILYSFNYDNINDIFQQYFKKVIYYKNLKDILFKQIKDSDNINNISSIFWNVVTPVADNTSSTIVVNTNDIELRTCLTYLDPSLRLCTSSAQCPSGYFCSNGVCVKSIITETPNISGSWCDLHINTNYGNISNGDYYDKYMFFAIPTTNSPDTMPTSWMEKTPGNPTLVSGVVGFEYYWVGWIYTHDYVSAGTVRSLAHKYKVDALGNITLSSFVLTPDWPQVRCPNDINVSLLD